MSETIDPRTEHVIWHDEVMPKLQELGTSLRTPSKIEAAFRAYVDARYEAIATGMILNGKSTDDDRLSNLPDVDGLLRWSILDNAPLLTSLCLQDGANSTWQGNWPLVYAIVHGFDEVAKILCDEGKASVEDALRSMEDNRYNSKETTVVKVLELWREQHYPEASRETSPKGDDWAMRTVPSEAEQLALSI
jgi:hypothetical protein